MIVMQSKDDKQLDSGLESIIQHVKELRIILIDFIYKLETEYQTLNWNTVLDNFALLSGQISSLNRFLKSDKLPPLKSYVPIPYSLSPDTNPELLEMTEGRIPFFNHEVVPIYLRTKPEPEIEERMAQMQSKAQSLSHDNLQKQINTLNKLSNIIQETLKNSKDALECDPVQKGSLVQMNSLVDTNILVAAVVSGKGLKLSSSSSSQQLSSSSQQGEERHGRGVSGTVNNNNSGSQQQQGMNVGKVPSTIKTNIKTNINTNPYNR